MSEEIIDPEAEYQLARARLTMLRSWLAHPYTKIALEMFCKAKETVVSSMVKGEFSNDALREFVGEIRAYDVLQDHVDKEQEDLLFLVDTLSKQVGSSDNNDK